jgi:hypothetical protein
LPGGAQEGGDGGFEVGCESEADGDEGVLFGKRQKLFAARLDVIGRGFHCNQCNC